jgi:hypothetical protein
LTPYRAEHASTYLDVYGTGTSAAKKEDRVLLRPYSRKVLLGNQSKNKWRFGLICGYDMRLRFIEMITNPKDAASLLPEEDREEMILNFFLLRFMPFRSRVYYLPSSNATDIHSRLRLLHWSTSILMAAHRRK